MKFFISLSWLILAPAAAVMASLLGLKWLKMKKEQPYKAPINAILSDNETRYRKYVGFNFTPASWKELANIRTAQLRGSR